MILGVANNGEANAETIRDGTLGNVFRGVVGALRVNVRAQIFEEGFDIGFREEQDEIDIAQRGHQQSAGLLVEDRAAGSFQAVDTGIGIDGDDEDIAFAFRPREIADVANMKSIETAVGQDDALALALEIPDGRADEFTRLDFGVGGPHGEELK